MNATQKVNYLCRPDLSSFTARLRYIRRLSGLTQSEMAEILEVTLSHYSKVESGKRNLSSELLDRVSEFCNVTLDWLVKGPDHPGDTRKRSRLQLVQDEERGIPGSMGVFQQKGKSSPVLYTEELRRKVQEFAARLGVAEEAVANCLVGIFDEDKRMRSHGFMEP